MAGRSTSDFPLICCRFSLFYADEDQSSLEQTSFAGELGCQVAASVHKLALRNTVLQAKEESQKLTVLISSSFFDICGSRPPKNLWTRYRSNCYTTIF